MYRPHEAREDTVLFPAFRSVVTPQEYSSLGEEFEEKEHQLFGEEGFSGIVEQTAAIERALGIYELNQFKQRVPPAEIRLIDQRIRLYSAKKVYTFERSFP